MNETLIAKENLHTSHKLVHAIHTSDFCTKYFSQNVGSKGSDTDSCGDSHSTFFPAVIQPIIDKV